MNIHPSDSFLGSVELIGDNYQGWIAASPRATPTTNLLAMEEGWTQSASHLTCEYLGFKGAYATTAPVVQNDTFGDQINGITNISCPEDAVNITQCWYDDQRTLGEESVVEIVCCPGIV